MASYKIFIENLYRIVDNRDVDGLVKLLHPEVRFTFGNSETIVGLAAVKSANEQFFRAIHSMQHEMDGIYEAGNTLICDGQVNYVRLDGSLFEAKFATILTLRDGLIYDYKIFADLSAL